jgi:hypothetical protein
MSWVHIAIELAAIALALLAFAGIAKKSKDPMHVVSGQQRAWFPLLRPCHPYDTDSYTFAHGFALQVSKYLVEIIAFILLPISILIVAYALFVSFPFLIRDAAGCFKTYIDASQPPTFLVS